MTDLAEYQIFDGNEFFAEVSGPRDQAFREALNYAHQCDDPRIEEITRKVILFASPLQDSRQQALTKE